MLVYITVIQHTSTNNRFNFSFTVYKSFATVYWAYSAVFDMYIKGHLDTH